MNEFEEQALHQLTRIADGVQVLSALVQVMPADSMGSRKPAILMRSLAGFGYDPGYDPITYLKDLENERNAKRLELELGKERE